ncbi:unnamed protein product [Zymoseptoria tritici ST99CH_1E4]|uniref:Cytochrome P450 monooxygenase n=1 Tax=Zymoseptoria tritici ST99CH_1E4 TaxID=1276532 RepID=A0A2H1GL81_ZYMTR|nr:unnamed protein product [Zymoseptoria tritici ST99CH_1E4]
MLSNSGQEFPGKPEVWFGVITTSSLMLLAYIRLVRSPLRSIPGPRIAALTGAWRNLKYFQGRWMQDIIALHKRYGPVVRISPSEVSITDQAVVRRIYGFNTRYQKTSWYDTWRYAGSTESVFATRNHQDHQFLRKRVFKIYSMSSILSMEHLIDEVVDLSLQQLHCHVMDNRPVRLDRWTMFFAYEVVSNLALGHLKGFLERGEDVNNIIDSNHTGFWLNANVGYLPGQSRWFSNYYFLWVMTKLGSNFSAISDWIDGAVTNGRRGHSSISRGPDLLQHFLNMSDGDGNPVSDEEVASEIGNVLGAGADTTGILIMATIKYLIENQSDYCRLQREVDAEYRRLQLSAGQEIRKVFDFM